MIGNKAILIAGAAAVLLFGCDNGRGGRDPSTPSGFAVPRYVKLKFDEINARAGPSEEHEKLWVYHAKGLPVQVVAETKDWRRICDPEGGLSWVAARMLEGGEAMAIRIKPGPLELRRNPEAGAAVVGGLPERGVAQIDRCESGWCRLKVGNIEGWAPQSEIWGADPAPQCAGLPAPAEPLPLE